MSNRIRQLTYRTGFSIDGGEAAFHRLLSQQGGGWEMPTAIFAVCDEVAMGVMYAIREHGLRVPMDLSVVGVDGHDFAYLFDLTTVSQPVRDQGRIAARLLLEQINTRPPRPPSVVSVGSNLIRRGTSGPVPRRLDQLRNRGAARCSVRLRCLDRWTRLRPLRWRTNDEGVRFGPNPFAGTGPARRAGMRNTEPAERAAGARRALGASAGTAGLPVRRACSSSVGRARSSKVR